MRQCGGARSAQPGCQAPVLSQGKALAVKACATRGPGPEVLHQVGELGENWALQTVKTEEAWHGVGKRW